jgi:HELP motif
MRSTYAYILRCIHENTCWHRWGGAADRGTDVDLELDWVHGYRSADCRNNACYSASGDVVYHAAAVGIVYRKGTDESAKLQLSSLLRSLTVPCVTAIVVVVSVAIA